MCHNCGVKSCNSCNKCNTCEPQCPLRIFFKDVIACRTSDTTYEALKQKYGINNGDTLDVVAKLLLQNIDAINTKLETLDINAITILINSLTAKIGDLSTLKTTDKSTLVAAINEIFDKIGDLSTLTTTNKTSVVNAINEVNAKTTLGTLNNLPGVVTQATNFTDAINDRQPVWKKSTTITVGASQAAPFNNLETALTELSKYHFSNNFVNIDLEDGTYNVSNTSFLNILNLSSFIINGKSGNRANVILNGAINKTTSLLELKNLTVKNTGTGNIIAAGFNGNIVMSNAVIENGASSTDYLVFSNNGGRISLFNTSIINKSTTILDIVRADTESSTSCYNVTIDNQGNQMSNGFVAYNGSSIFLQYENVSSAIPIKNVNTAHSAINQSDIKISSNIALTYNNINIFSRVAISSSFSIVASMNVNINGRDYTYTENSTTKKTILFECSNNSNFISDCSLIANKFSHVVLGGGHGNVLVSNITATDINDISIYITHGFRLYIQGSISVNSQTLNPILIAHNSDMTTDSLQILNSGSVIKAILTNNSRLYRNTPGSNIGTSFTASNGSIVNG